MTIQSIENFFPPIDHFSAGSQSNIRSPDISRKPKDFDKEEIEILQKVLKKEGSPTKQDEKTLTEVCLTNM